MTLDLVPVPIGVCPCPGTPHEGGDIVYLAPVLSTPGGMAASAAIREGITDEVLLAEKLGGIWLRHGIRTWTFVDEEGDPIPVSEAAALDLLPWGKGGRLVADKADDLYAQDVLAPFVEAVERARRSPRGQTPKKATSANGATSATPTSPTKRRASSSTLRSVPAMPRTPGSVSG